MTADATKEALRAAAKQRVAALPEAARRKYDRRIVALLAADLRFEGARTVLGYSALGDEACIDALWPIAADRGKRVLLPKLSPQGELSFAPWNRNDGVRPGTFGVGEPPAPPENPTGACLVLVPGRAFDASGTRLGRGGGHYDRVLGGLRKLGPAIGVAYHCQLVDEVPGLPHDVPVDAVVTELGFSPG
jgi:5-formyltetrahydrofolate cyclo-ligase